MSLSHQLVIQELIRFILYMCENLALLSLFWTQLSGSLGSLSAATASPSLIPVVSLEGPLTSPGIQVRRTQGALPPRVWTPAALFPSCPGAARAEPATSTSSMWLREPTRSLPFVSNPSLPSPKRGMPARPSIWGRLNPNRGSWAPSLGPSSHLAANSPPPGSLAL